MSRRVLLFTQSRFYGGDDTVLLELARHWPSPDKLTVWINSSHPARQLYEDKLRGRADVQLIEEPTIEEEKESHPGWRRLTRRSDGLLRSFRALRPHDRS